jgi:GGDEF domain-containing protein
MPDTEAPQGAPLAERILAAVRGAPVDLGGGLLRTISVSIGIAAVRPAADDDRKTSSDQLLADAMAALHRVKRRGGDGYEIAAVTIAGGT